MASRKGYVPDGIRDDTFGGMQLLGDASVLVVPGLSELDLYQVGVMTGMKEATPGPVAWCREFADGHGDLVAGV